MQAFDTDPRVIHARRLAARPMPLFAGQVAEYRRPRRLRRVKAWAWRAGLLTAEAAVIYGALATVLVAARVVLHALPPV